MRYSRIIIMMGNTQYENMKTCFIIMKKKCYLLDVIVVVPSLFLAALKWTPQFMFLRRECEWNKNEMCEEKKAIMQSKTAAKSVNIEWKRRWEQAKGISWRAIRMMLRRMKVEWTLNGMLVPRDDRMFSGVTLMKVMMGK